MSFGVDSRLSILGGVGYPPAHASRYAGAQFGMARLTVKNDCIVISPLWFWRRLLRMPVLRIPLTAIQGASRISWGVKFTVPADAELDGARFKRWYGNGQKLETLIRLLEDRGITVQTMPVTHRVSGYVDNYAIAQRPGWIWRDRGWPGFLESAVALALGSAVFYVVGFFSHAPLPVLVWFAFVNAVAIWGWIAGYRRRKKSLAQRDRDRNLG